MEIRQFRVALRAKSFERTCRFYGDVMGLPRVGGWQEGDLQAALYQAGPGLVEVIGRTAAAEAGGRDERFDYQGPRHKLTVHLVVPSAERAYEELLFRDPNIPGGLRPELDGALGFETHDPDGVKVVCREG